MYLIHVWIFIHSRVVHDVIPEGKSAEYLAAAVHGRAVPREVEEPLLGFLLYLLTDRQPGVVRPRGGGVPCQGKVAPATRHLCSHQRVGL